MTKNKKRGWFRSAEEALEEEQAQQAQAQAQAVEQQRTRPDSFVPPLPAPVPDAATAGPAVKPGGEIDANAIFDAAGIPREDRERVERARNLLRALPHGVSPDVRKQIVETALTSFGIATERIVDGARKETAALQGFIRASQEATDKVVEENRARIHALEQEILRVRQAADHVAAVHQSRVRSANTEMIAVQEVLSFFGQTNSAFAGEVDFEETTEDRSDWGVQIPLAASSRKATDRNSRPPPSPTVASDSKTTPVPGADTRPRGS